MNSQGDNEDEEEEEDEDEEGTTAPAVVPAAASTKGRQQQQQQQQQSRPAKRQRTVPGFQLPDQPAPARMGERDRKQNIRYNSSDYARY